MARNIANAFKKLLEMRLFEKNILRKSSFILNPVSFMESFMKKVARVSYDSLFNLPDMFRSFLSLAIHQLAIFWGLNSQNFFELFEKLVLVFYTSYFMMS